MKSTIKFLAVVLVFSAVPVFAQTEQADLLVEAVVVANCSISTTGVDFGNYDPIATVADDATGTITVACTRGIPSLSLEIDNGVSGVREMTDGGTEVLPYQLYSDAGRTTVWGTGAAGIDPSNVAYGPGAVNPAGKTITVYGRIAVGQDAAVGNYSQLLQAIVNF